MIIDFFQKLFANRNLNKKLSFIGNCILLAIKIFVFSLFIIRLINNNDASDKYLKLIVIAESLLIGFLIFGISLILSICALVTGIKSKAKISLYSAFSVTTAVYAVIVVFYLYKGFVPLAGSLMAILMVLLSLILLVIQITRVRQINQDKTKEEE